MGKKLKKKVQWRRLSLNELPNKSLSDDGCDEDCDDDEGDKNPDLSTPTPTQRPQGFHPRRPFHPNFHPGDQRRFPPPPFDPRGIPFERRSPSERFPHPKYFGRPFQYDQRAPFPALRRKPFKFFGRGGAYVRGPSPYAGDGDLSRQQSEEDRLATDEDREENKEDTEEGERPSQPVHTVLIDNEQYTKIQTPRQEVIFKKSSLDRKRDSVDLGSAPPSVCGSTSCCDRNSQCDQGSVAGSVEETNLSFSEDTQQESCVDHHPYERDSNDIFMGEPGKPPLAGVVMQAAYPGGPMISIPVHWTPFLDPGLIPGDTALTPLDPAFTHVLDPKNLPVDAHILPVQHDSNGCPVTVQVRVNADGQPIEIEPSAFTVSLSSLDPHQQEVLLRGRTDVITGTPIPPAFLHSAQTEQYQASEELEIQKEPVIVEENADQMQVEKTKGKEEDLEKGKPEHKDSEDSCSDSQYASMSESSTAPTTPSAELSDPSSESSKSRGSKSSVETPPEEDSRRVSRSDSLLDSASVGTETGDEPCSCVSAGSSSPDSHGETNVEEPTIDAPCVDPSRCVPLSDNDTHSLNETRLCSPTSDGKSLSDLPCVPQQENCPSKQICESQDLNNSSEKSESSKRRNKKSKKSRSLSTESSVSSQNSLAENKTNEKVSGESVSKYQAKKSAKLLKKDKKRLRKDKNKAKKNGSKMSMKVDVPLSTELQRKGSTESESQDSNVFTEEEIDSEKVTKEKPKRISNVKSVTAKETPTEHETLEEKVETVDESDKNNESLIATEVEPEEQDAKMNQEEKAEEEGVSESQKDLETFESCQMGDTELQESKQEKIISEDGKDETVLTDRNEETVSEDVKEETVSEDAKEKSERQESKQENTVTEDVKEETVSGDAKEEPIDKNIDEDKDTKDTDISTDKGIDKTTDTNMEQDEMNKTNSETSEDKKQEREMKSSEIGEDGNYVCKPGYVMVPILTPYYDPAILYGYPLVIPEIPPERNYSRKKKKKWKRKYQEDVCLDTELYAGEPFVTTPNGYIMPMEASQVCQLHGYQYLPNMFPFPEEGLMPMDQSPYLPQLLPDAVVRQRRHHYAEMEAYTKAKFARLYEDERVEAKEALHEQTSKNNKTENYLNESCDSGVSEPEDLTQCSQGKDSQEEKQGDKEKTKGNKKNREKGKKGNDKSSESEEKEKDSKLKAKKDPKKKTKSPKKGKGKKETIEILEPDFSSFSSSILRFESPEDREDAKTKSGKMSKTRKKKNSNAGLPSDKTSSLNVVSPKEAETSTKSISDKNTSSCSSSTKSTKSKKSAQARTISESQTETVKSLKDSTKTKEKQDTPVNTPSKGSKRKSKSSRKKIEKETSSVNNEDASLLSTTAECLISTNSDNKLHEDDNESQESENITASEEYLSQESENVNFTDECLSQESESVSSETCLSQESDNVVLSEETSEEKENDTHDEERLDLNETSLLEENTSIQEPEIDECIIIPDREYDSSTEVHHDEPEIPCSELIGTVTLTSGEVPSHFTDDITSISTSLPSQCTEYANSSTEETSTSVTPTPEDLVKETSPDDEGSMQSFKDLGVTEAVRRWIREVTPEKAFAISQETRSLLLSSVISPCDSEEESVDDEFDNVTSDTEQQSKNVQGNPSVASPSESSLGVSSERVALPVCSDDVTSSRRYVIPSRKVGRFRRSSSSSQDVFDDYDGESVVSSLSRGRLYSSSSTSSIPLACNLEDTTPIDDPRVYDPAVYSKYYQLGADVHATPSNASTRESTLSPTPFENESDEVELFSAKRTPPDPHCMSLATELYKSEKIRTNMTHISPSLCEDHLTLPHCGCAGPILGNEIHEEVEGKAAAWDAGDNLTDGEISPSRNTVPSSSVSSSGIGSSLASTPVVSPAHQPQSSSGNTNSRPKLEPHPLKNLSAGDGPLPCKAVCCSVM